MSIYMKQKNQLDGLKNGSFVPSTGSTRVDIEEKKIIDLYERV